MPDSAPDHLSLLSDLLDMARAAGAEAADAVMLQGTSLSVARRLGKPEQVERSEGTDIGLRVFVGKRAAVVSSSDPRHEALRIAAGRAVEMARAVPEDEYAGLAEPDMLATSVPALDLDGAGEPSESVLSARAAAAEDAARAVSGVTNSEGARAGWGRTRVALATSDGFSGGYAVSHRSVSASVIAGEGTGMERDYSSATAVHDENLEDPAVVGRRAGKRAVRRLNPRKVGTARVPLVYEPRMARGLLSSLAGAINGASIARGTSFLRDRMGDRLFAPGVAILDDPLRPRGLRSRPFDGEGTATAPLALVEDGVLKHWLLDSRSARKLGLQSNGRAARGAGGGPSPSATNLYLHAGEISPQTMIGEIGSGLLVTELIGMGVNGIT
ncbi:MAG: TldD/PmbA family protein, partial [Acetobacterales bacterium]